MKRCKECKKLFKPYRNLAQKYCSIECSNKGAARRAGRERTFGLPTGTVGTMSELKVVVDLLGKGYEVYKPLTPNCSGDILIEKDKKFLKIEVRTGYRSHIGNLTFSPNNIRASIIAVVVLRKNEINYLDIQKNKISL